MSLQYQNGAETPAETENVQRAASAIPYYSLILIGCLVVVSLSQFAVDGGDSILSGGEKSALLAGFFKPLFRDGQYWRILTGASLHGGLIHLAFNCYAFYTLGKLIEILSNRAHLAIVFLLSAIGGGVLSLIFLPYGNSVGASGGIVGFLGYLTVYGYRRRELLSSSFLRGMLFNIGFIALYGVALNQRIDNFGHLGGLLTGAIYGFFQISGDVYHDPTKVGNATKIAGLIALGVFILVCVFSILIVTGIVPVEIPSFYLSAQDR